MEMPGSLIVCGDYAVDLEAIAKVLNTFDFDQDWRNRDERFVVVDGRIQTDRYLIDNPGAMPYCWYVEGEDEPCYEPSLEEVSGAIAPLLTSGILELVSVNSSYGQYVKLERLSIRSDGWAQSERQRYDNVKVGEDPFECNSVKGRVRKNWYECSTETVECHPNHQASCSEFPH
jgi:hypothetical protein